MQTPSGYVSGAAAGARYEVRSDLEPFVRNAIETAGSLEAFARSRASATLAGRGEVHVTDSPAGPLLVRHYRRGGAVASALGDRYVRIGRIRPFHELRISEAARLRGVPTPAVAAGVIYPDGVFYRGDLATEYMSDTMTLADVTFGPDRRGDSERFAAWRAAGRLVRRTVDAGLVHADLNLRNVLIGGRAAEPVAYLLDLDRCRITDSVAAVEKDRMVARLRRSARKIASPAGPPTGEEFEAFEAGLSRGDEGSGG